MTLEYPFALRFPGDLKNPMEKYAKRLRISKNTFVVYAVEFFIKRLQDMEKKEREQHDVVLEKARIQNNPRAKRKRGYSATHQALPRMVKRRGN